MEELFRELYRVKGFCEILNYIFMEFKYVSLNVSVVYVYDKMYEPHKSSHKNLPFFPEEKRRD